MNVMKSTFVNKHYHDDTDLAFNIKRTGLEDRVIRGELTLNALDNGEGERKEEESR